MTEEKPFMHEYDRKQYFIKHFLEKGYGLSHIESMYQDVYDEEEKTEIAEAYLAANPPAPKTIGKVPSFECPECGEDLVSQLKEFLESENPEAVLECPKCGMKASLKVSQ